MTYKIQRHQVRAYIEPTDDQDIYKVLLVHAYDDLPPKEVEVVSFYHFSKERTMRRVFHRALRTADACVSGWIHAAYPDGTDGLSED